MKRLVASLVVVAFLGSCGAQDSGEIQRESRTVEPENARSASVDLRMGAGELDVAGGADAMMEADFVYSLEEWRPEIGYGVNDGTGELRVRQGGGEDVSTGGGTRNEWDLRLNDDIPTELRAQMGAGESNLDLDSLTLTGLDLQMGAGRTTVDLTGAYEQDLAASIQGGVGRAKVLLPGEIGVRVEAGGGLGRINTQGLTKDGEAYVNDSYGDSDVVLEVDVQGGVGEINLEVV
jgi:hypothetical protein